MVIVQQGPLLAMFPSVTHVVLGERNKNVEKKDREAGRCREKKGGCENREKIIIGLRKRDKLRNKECIHEREGG